MVNLVVTGVSLDVQCHRRLLSCGFAAAELSET